MYLGAGDVSIMPVLPPARPDDVSIMPVGPLRPAVQLGLLLLVLLLFRRR